MKHKEGAKKLRAVALKWFHSGHKDFHNDREMLACYCRDYRDLMYIATLIDQGADKSTIQGHMHALDTIVRDQIPSKLYNYYHEDQS